MILNENLFETLNEKVIKLIDNGYHDLWELDDRYAVHNDGGIFHVIDTANRNNYLLDTDSIDEVNAYIKDNLNLDVSIEPSSRQFKKKANIDVNKDKYLRDAAKMDWESGHPYDPDDFSYFKKVCKEDGYNVNEEDFQKYWEYFDECRAKQFAEDDDSDNDLGPWEEMESKQVKDHDGFMTDYTWYVKDNDDGSETHVMIFGDQNLYTPMNSEPDAEFDGEEIAREWFDNYYGFDSDDSLEFAEFAEQRPVDDLEESLEEAKSVIKKDLIDWLHKHEKVALTKEEFDYLVQNLWEAIKREEAMSGESYRSIEEVDVGELIDGSDDPAHSLGYKLMGLIDEEDLNESILTEKETDPYAMSMQEAVKLIVDKFGNNKYQYQLKAEEYQRFGPGEIYTKKFFAPNDYLAYFSMVLHKAPTIDNLEDSFDPAEVIELFEENDSIESIAEYAGSVWWGDGDDYIISLDNLSTNETLYASDYEPEAEEDDTYDWDEELEEALNGTDELNQFIEIAKELGFIGPAQMKHILEAGRKQGKSELETLLWVKETFDGKLPDSLIDGLTDEFLEIAQEIGITDQHSYEQFIANEVEPGETYTQAIKRYKQELIDAGVDLSKLTERKLEEIAVLNINEPAIFDAIANAKAYIHEKKYAQAKDALDYAANLLVEPMNEGAMSNLDVEIKEAGGKKSWKEKARQELADMIESLEYLKTYAPKEVNAGGNYDSTIELDKDIEDLEKAINDLNAKLNFVDSIKTIGGDQE